MKYMKTNFLTLSDEYEGTFDGLNDSMKITDQHSLEDNSVEVN